MLEPLREGERRYRYDMVSAYYAGILIHPVVHIRILAPDAHDLECHTIADCWTFSAPPLSRALPSYVADVTEGYNDWCERVRRRGGSR